MRTPEENQALYDLFLSHLQQHPVSHEDRSNELTQVYFMSGVKLQKEMDRFLESLCGKNYQALFAEILGTEIPITQEVLSIMENYPVDEKKLKEVKPGGILDRDRAAKVLSKILTGYTMDELIHQLNGKKELLSDAPEQKSFEEDMDQVLLTIIDHLQADRRGAAAELIAQHHLFEDEVYDFAEFSDLGEYNTRENLEIDYEVLEEVIAEAREIASDRSASQSIPSLLEQDGTVPSSPDASNEARKL